MYDGVLVAGAGGCAGVAGFMAAGVVDALECLTGHALGRSLEGGEDVFGGSLLCIGHDGCKDQLSPFTLKAMKTYWWLRI